MAVAGGVFWARMQVCAASENGGRPNCPPRPCRAYWPRPGGLQVRRFSGTLAAPLATTFDLPAAEIGPALLPPAPRLPWRDVLRWGRIMGLTPQFAAPMALQRWLHDGVCDWLAAPLVDNRLALGPQVLYMVGRSVSCRFCAGAGRAVLQLLGLTAAEIAELQDVLANTSRSSTAHGLQMRVVAAVARGVPAPTDPTAAELAAVGMTSVQTAELGFMAARAVLTSRITLATRVAPVFFEQVATPWLAPLRPLLRLSLRLLGAKKGEPRPLRPEDRRGPLAVCVTVLDGVPAAALVRQLIDAALAPSALTAAEKALIFGVVAMTLGNQAAQAEMTERAASFGAAKPDRVLQTLGADETAEFREMLGLARALVRPEPSDVHRRAQLVLASSSPHRYIDALGTAAVANAVLRLPLLRAFLPSPSGEP